MQLKELWEFFYQSNFIYPKKEEALRPVLRKVQDTFSLLVQDRASPILRTLVIRSEDTAIDAHISLLHAYTNTWIMQHLSSIGIKKRNKYTVRDIQLGAINTMSQLRNIRWLRTYFQPQKHFPDRIAGRFARRIKDPSQSNLNIYAYLTSSTDPRANKGRLHVRPAAPVDFQLIEKYFVRNGSLIEFLAEDGTRDEMNLESIRHEYHNHGLTRYRHVTVAERQGIVCGAALMEFSSPGLNLSEVTNRCTIHIWDREPPPCTDFPGRTRTLHVPAFGLSFLRCDGKCI